MMIDPIPVKEERERLQVTAGVLNRGLSAADALVWFSEYGSSTEVITLQARLVASSTAYADRAQEYINRAASEFRGQIVDKAIAIARHEFDQAKLARNPPKESRR